MIYNILHKIKQDWKLKLSTLYCCPFCYHVKNESRLLVIMESLAELTPCYTKPLFSDILVVSRANLLEVHINNLTHLWHHSILTSFPDRSRRIDSIGVFFIQWLWCFYCKGFYHSSQKKCILVLIHNFLCITFRK